MTDIGFAAAIGFAAIMGGALATIAGGHFVNLPLASLHGAANAGLVIKPNAPNASVNLSMPSLSIVGRWMVGVSEAKSKLALVVPSFRPVDTPGAKQGAHPSLKPSARDDLIVQRRLLRAALPPVQAVGRTIICDRNTVPNAHYYTSRECQRPVRSAWFDPRNAQQVELVAGAEDADALPDEPLGAAVGLEPPSTTLVAQQDQCTALPAQAPGSS